MEKKEIAKRRGFCNLHSLIIWAPVFYLSELDGKEIEWNFLVGYIFFKFLLFQILVVDNKKKEKGNVA